MTLTEQLILLQAPNPAAAENGRKLWKKGSFSALHRTEDNNLYWAECAGSGKTPYRVSIDWTDPDAPVCRCSCPSRQFPCKHALGLMFQQLTGGTSRRRSSPRTSRTSGPGRRPGRPRRSRKGPQSPKSPTPPPGRKS